MLAGCGGRTAAPAAPVVNAAPAVAVDAPPVDEDACTDALAADMEGVKVRRIEAVDPLRPDDAAAAGACVVELQDQAEITVLVAGIAHDGGAWRQTSVQAGLLYQIDDEETGEGQEGKVELALVEIADGEQAIRVDLIQDGFGPGYGSRSVDTTLYRVRPDGLVALVGWQTSSHTGEADNLEEAELEVLDAVTGGFFDLALHHRTSSIQWAAGETTPEERWRTEIYRWDGDVYLLADTVDEGASESEGYGDDDADGDDPEP